ncbi:MAG TPA: Clp protease N-terminal domain-containing protein [Symbiobacteriaceae bacterium]|jgi:ATP-dependent Clp protease ATP-binding subunit ClpC
MLENFTDGAQRVVALAQVEARRLNSTRIGTEHLLLGLLRAGESTAILALRALGLEMDGLSLNVERLAGPGGGPVSGAMPFSPRAGQVLTVLAPDEAKALAKRQVGPEHLLLGLIREGEGLAAVALDEAGVDLLKARTAVQLVLSAQSGLPVPELAPQALDPDDWPEGPLPDEEEQAETGESPEFERAVRVVRRARDEAFMLGAPELRLEHFLMAVLADPEGSDLADLLKVRGVTLEWLRELFRPH